MIKLIIFDLDGVLCPLNHKIVMDFYNLVAERLKLEWRWSDSVENFRKWHNHRYYENWKSMGVNESDFEMVDVWFAEYMNQNSPMDTQTYQMLESLRLSGYKLAVLSNGPEKCMNVRLGKAKDFFAVLLGNETLGKRLKPDPFGVFKVLDYLKFRPNQAIMLGDSSSDMEAARAAKLALAVGVTSGMASKDELAAAGAQWIMEHAWQVVKIPKGENIFSFRDRLKT